VYYHYNGTLKKKKNPANQRFVCVIRILKSPYNYYYWKIFNTCSKENQKEIKNIKLKKKQNKIIMESLKTRSSFEGKKKA